MKGGSLFKKIIFSSWFLAGIPAIIIMSILPALNSRFSLTIDPGPRTEGQAIYADLNSDSVSEFIMAGKGVPYYHLLVMGNNDKVYDQWNLQDIFNPIMSPFFIGNYDHDRCNEIYVFTHKEDSLFLNINEFFENGGTKLNRIFIAKIGYVKGEVTSAVYKSGFYDENMDGKDELYFVISTGFGLEPRRVYYYDLVNNKLKTSMFTGTIIKEPEMTDADNDGKPEIFGLMSGSGNQNSIVPYTDWSTWLMVFSDKLEFKFEPVEFPGYPSLLQISPYSYGNLKGYVLSRYLGSADESIPGSSVMIYTANGRYVRSRNLSEIGITQFAHLEVIRKGNADRIFMLSNKICELDTLLNEIWATELDFKNPFKPYKADINNDQIDEYLLYSSIDEQIEIFGPSFNKLYSARFKAPNDNWILSWQLAEGNFRMLYLWSDNQGYFLSLVKNKFYILSYLAYPGIYLFFLSLIILTKKISAYQVIEKESLKHRLVTLQLQGIKAQLDPHFTFNTLNSISSLIYLEDRQAAYDYMNKFTTLLRGMLNDAERIYRSLEEEIIFVTTYLDLEKLRLVGKFDYRIEIGEGVTKHEQVPKLVLQTFAENSIKHGIMPYSEGGFLKISVSRDKNLLKLTIEDNGIGRINAAGKGDSTGLGLKLTGEFYNILNQINKRPIKHQITDLYKESGDPAGTRVDVWVPVEG